MERRVPWPDGIQCPVALDFHIDAESLLVAIDPQNASRPITLSQGTYGPRVGVPRILALLRKYRLLAEWRRVRDGGPGASPDRAALRALSVEFPGALRELDVLGLPEILRRLDLLGDVSRASEPWPAWILAYHRLMRAALAAKRAAGRTRRLSEAALSEVLAAANAEVEGDLVDEAFARAAARPASGRMAIVVLRTLGRHFGVPAEELATTLFPRRRPPPYDLEH